MKSYDNKYPLDYYNELEKNKHLDTFIQRISLDAFYLL